MRRLLIIIALLAATTSLFAHKLSDSYLRLVRTNGVFAGAWEIALKDLEYAVGLDSNNDSLITWGEVKAGKKMVVDHLQSVLIVKSSGASLPLSLGEVSIASRSDGAYAVFPMQFEDRGQAGTTMEYRFLFDIDQQHRGLLRLEHEHQMTTTVFTPTARTKALNIDDPASTASFSEFVYQGVLHIWKGLDHVLFLLALLLPSVLVRLEGDWHPVEHFRSVLTKVVKVVTSFTVAHSITLVVATLGWIHFPANIIEPIIACSVVVAALNNIFAWFKEGLWRFTFLFGLVHGFGFAFVLKDLGLSKGDLANSLIGFNIGVELGQLAIVAVLLPIIFLARYSVAYRVYTLKLGSLCICLLAATWMFERIFSFKVLPF